MRTYSVVWWSFAAFARSAAVSSGDVAAVDDVTALTDEELCGAWRRSTSAVAAPRQAAELEELVDARDRYLDELERRSPEAFAEWLNADPEAAVDPAVYYTGADRGERGQE
ncbi:hypothetical protein [Kribbella sp. NPDC050470]|uniref:hypothetical protein n=1 Tax=unclassified Kribbella TaxID=2644121 RepID=UPI0037B4CD24